MKQNERIDRRNVRAWMFMEGIKPSDIQKSLSHRSHVQTVETLQGVRNDRRVLAWLLDHGCPAEYVQLPKSRRKEKQ